MLAKVYSGAVVGLDGELIEVEVDIGPGCLRFTSSGCRTRRCRSRRSGCGRPSATPAAASRISRITVNLAPADVRKEGPAYDLPIAVGVLIASRAGAGRRLEEPSSWVSCRWTAVCATPTASCRWSAWRGAAASRRLRAGGRRARGRAGRRRAHLSRCDTLGRSSRHLQRRPSLSSRYCRTEPARRRRTSLLRRHRLRRRQGPGARQARAGGRGRRRPQPADDRPAGRRQDAAGASAALDPAAA